MLKNYNDYVSYLKFFYMIRYFVGLFHDLIVDQWVIQVLAFFNVILYITKTLTKEKCSENS